MIDEIILYHGDNGAHEFYETSNYADRHLCIIRNHSDPVPDRWFVINVPGKVSITIDRVGPLSEVLRAIADATESRIIVDPSRKFVVADDGEGPMPLVRI